MVQIIRHPKYNESLSVLGGGDIALLRLEGAVKLSESVYPVSLPDASLTVSSKKICWVTGWGDIEYNSGYHVRSFSTVGSWWEPSAPGSHLAPPHSTTAPTLPPAGGGGLHRGEPGL